MSPSSWLFDGYEKERPLRWRNLPPRFWGVPGFGLLEVREIDGELEYLVETTDTVAGCPECGTIAKAKDRRKVVLRDLAHGDRPVRIRWRKRIWLATERLDDATTFTIGSDVAKVKTLSKSLRRWRTAILELRI